MKGQGVVNVQAVTDDVPNTKYFRDTDLADPFMLPVPNLATLPLTGMDNADDKRSPAARRYSGDISQSASTADPIKHQIAIRS